MQKCQYHLECAFYNDLLKDMPVEAGFLKTMYCHKLSEKCQRFKHAETISVSDTSNDLPPLILYARK